MEVLVMTSQKGLRQLGQVSFWIPLSYYLRLRYDGWSFRSFLRPGGDLEDGSYLLRV